MRSMRPRSSFMRASPRRRRTAAAGGSRRPRSASVDVAVALGTCSSSDGPAQRRLLAAQLQPRQRLRQPGDLGAGGPQLGLASRQPRLPLLDAPWRSPWARARASASACQQRRLVAQAHRLARRVSARASSSPSVVSRPPRGPRAPRARAQPLERLRARAAALLRLRGGDLQRRQLARPATSTSSVSAPSARAARPRASRPRSTVRSLARRARAAPRPRCSFSSATARQVRRAAPRAARAASRRLLRFANPRRGPSACRTGSISSARSAVDDLLELARQLGQRLLAST